MILRWSKEGLSVDEIGRRTARNKSVISRFLARMYDTRELAQAIIAAGSAKLAERIVAKASVEEAIEVLSRPGIGVIQPAPSKNAGQVGGIEVSVAVSSCGTAVKVTSGGNTNGEHELPEGAAAPGTPLIQTGIEAGSDWRPAEGEILPAVRAVGSS
jgi:hypothetical protein